MKLTRFGKPKPPDSFVTSVEIGDRPYDDVTVFFDYDDADPSVGIGEGATICSIVGDDGEELIDRVDNSQIRELEEQAIETVNQWWGDYLEGKAEFEAERRGD